MWEAKYILTRFEQLSGLRVERVLENRSVAWSSGREGMLVVKVTGKIHPTFVLFDDSGIRNWGFILPAAKRGLKNDSDD